VVKKDKPAAKKPVVEEEKKKEEEKKGSSMIDEHLNYTQYFKEFAPLTEEQKKKGLKHKYTIEITKAMYHKESFQVYSKYQEKIHNEPDKSSSGYGGFLCQSPLIDPNNKEDAMTDVSQGQCLDDYR
jgi:arginyl-tRNA--protein-N-Asp/Glu arginylyltransferase